MVLGSDEERQRLGQSLYSRALELARQEKLEEAEFHYQEALKHCPRDAQIWYHRGNLHEQQGMLESAIRCYEHARARDRRNPSYERSWREAVQRLDQLPAVPTDAPGGPDEREISTGVLPGFRPPSKPPTPPDKVVLSGLEAQLRVDLPTGLDEQETQVSASRETEPVPSLDLPTVHEPEPEDEGVRTVERIGGTWMLWSRKGGGAAELDDLDTVKTTREELFSDASSCTLVVPLDELELDAAREPLSGSQRGSRDTASFVNRRQARILDTRDLSVIALACLRLIAEGEPAQVLDSLKRKKYPGLKPEEVLFLEATAHISLAEQTLGQAAGMDGVLGEHLKTLKLWFDQR